MRKKKALEREKGRGAREYLILDPFIKKIETGRSRPDKGGGTVSTWVKKGREDLHQGISPSLANATKEKGGRGFDIPKKKTRKDRFENLSHLPP